MIGCKLMRTIASVGIEIMLILGLPCCLSSSNVRCLESADGAQSSRVPVPLPKDPYEAIKQAYLDGTGTESEPVEDPIETETPESPLTVAPPTSLPESTPHTLVPILRRTARITVRVLPAMSSGLSASVAEVAAMFESAFRKRFRSSYESSPSLSPPDLPYCGDEGLAAGVECSGMDDESHGLDDESHGLDDESHGLDDESRGLDDEGHSVESDRLGLEEEEEAVPGCQQQVAPVVGITVSAPLGLGYGALRLRELALEEDHVYSTFETGLEDDMVYIDVPAYPSPAPPIQTPPSPEWTSGSLPISPSPFVVPSPISSPMILLTVPSSVATPATAETE
ncbi:hypothetical protein Tco_0033841 [Tanacetum coccineum]